MATKEKGRARNSQGKLISLSQLLCLPTLETVAVKNVQIQDQAFERIQEYLDTGIAHAKKQPELQRDAH